MREAAAERDGTRPALFTRALPVAAMLLVALNDHVLKGAGLVPGAVTGKLSDLAGLYFAPLLVAELWTLARPTGDARAVLRRVAWAALGFGVLFAAIKTSPEASARFDAATSALLRRPVGNTVDPTDLVALLMLPLAVADARRVLRLRARAPA
jgi:hypothetical protein